MILLMKWISLSKLGKLFCIHFISFQIFKRCDRMILVFDYMELNLNIITVFAVLDMDFKE